MSPLMVVIVVTVVRDSESDMHYIIIWLHSVGEDVELCFRMISNIPEFFGDKVCPTSLPECLEANLSFNLI